MTAISALRTSGAVRWAAAAAVCMTAVLLLGGWQLLTHNGPSDSPRDAERRRHAKLFAENLRQVYVIQRQSVPLSQAGLDSFMTIGNQLPVGDPSTHLPYVFNYDQASMRVGEATFALGATCQDKPEGTAVRGLIVESDTSDLAVAIKLESGEYACATAR